MKTNLKTFDCELELDETGSVYKVIADPETKKEIQKYLTVYNKSKGYMIKQKTDTLHRMSSWNKDDEISAKMASLKEEIAVLKSEVRQDFWHKDECDNLLIPSGLWGIGTVRSNQHLNAEIVPFHVPGLREYQKEAVTAVLEYKKAMGVLATGLGKSKILASVAVSAAMTGKTVFVIVPTEYLVGQLYDTIKMLWPSTTAGGGKRYPDAGADITVCTAQSAKKYIHRQDVLIFDEGGHIAADTWSDIATHESFQYVYSFTATPFRSDGMDLAIFALGGPIVYQKGVRWGINNGWLSPCQVFILNITIKDSHDRHFSLPARTMRSSAYKKMVGSAYVLSLLKDQLVKAVAKGERCMVIFKTLDPAKKLRKLCEGVLDFNVADANFKKPLKDFAEGKISVLVATDRLISEGVDIPSATTLFLLTQNSSNSTTYQAVGRVLRKAPDKVAKVVDFAICGYEPFEKSKLARLAVYSDITDNIKEIKV